MNWLQHFLRPRIRSSARRETESGLWTKCSRCEKMLFLRNVKRDLFVCQHCGFYMMWPMQERLKHLFDEGQYRVSQCVQVPRDPLKFRDVRKYVDRLDDARKKTGLRDAVQVSLGKVAGFDTVCASFDFNFIGGSMGTEAGESLVHAAEQAVAHSCPLLIIASSGGARMQEGILSLMQMPRSTVALSLVRDAGLPSVVLMTHPTTGGVLASFASLGDVALAEPGAIIGFTGPRVIQETTKQRLPDHFQTADFQQDHGFLDGVVTRGGLRDVLCNVFSVLCKGKNRRSRH